jgi:mono/diheme cytochrome c family protein
MAKLPLAVGALAAVLAFGAVMMLSHEQRTEPEPAGARASSGLEVFSRMGCGSCHRLAAARSNGPIGPDLDERLESHTAESLKAQILAPDQTSIMPADFGERMTNAEIDALVGFLLVARR